MIVKTKIFFLTITLFFSSTGISRNCTELRVQFLNSHPIQTLVQAARKLTGRPPVTSSQALRLTSEERASSVPAANYLIDENGQYRPYAREFAAEFFGKTPVQMQAILDRMTESHARFGNAFKQKNPETGKYDQQFKVKVDGFAPMRKSQFDALVASTGPVMRAYRWILQEIYTSENLDLNRPQLKHLGPEAKAALQGIVQIVRSNIYYEKNLVHPSMKDYKFLTVGGFDATVGALNKVLAVFFEGNLGTPSGWANNVQLLETMKREYPELYATIRDRLPEDNTFALLKKAVDSNAVAWTGNEKGISVIIGPGVANGAHPDVAAIAMFSGMPLVRMQDLYIDRQGAVRLNTGKGANNPEVTGIYGRAEESSILQSNQRGISYRLPHTDEALEMGRQQGFELDPGVAYATVKNEDGSIKGFLVGPDGKPMLEASFEQLGRNPENPQQLPGELIDAVHNKKIYISNIGGRVVDDKRIFEAVSRYIAPFFVRNGEQIARPPKTLHKDEYPLFFASNPEQLKKYVVKIPDSSGGDGIYLLINKSVQERQEIQNMVKADISGKIEVMHLKDDNWSRYIIQEFADVTVVNTVENGPWGIKQYGTIANDMRIFSLMDADGNVFAGPNSMLLRTAQIGSASTNTSQGGGYAVAIIINDQNRDGLENRHIIPKPASHPHVGYSRQRQVEAFAEQCLYLSKELTKGKEIETLIRSTEKLIELHLDIMDLLGRDFSPFMATARDFIKHRISEAVFLTELRMFLGEIQIAPLPVQGIDLIINRTLQSNKTRPVEENYPETDGPWYFHYVLSQTEFSKLVRIDYFDQPIKVREFVRGTQTYDKFEVGRYVSSIDPVMNALIQEVEAAGGEVRYISATHVKSGEPDDRPQKPYAWINPQNGQYIIGIDLRQPNALAAMKHELSHFEDWVTIRDKYVQQAIPIKEAGLKANEDVLSSNYRVFGETKALAAEMKAEVIKGNIFNRGIVGRDRNAHERQYISRMMYPNIEGLRDILHKQRWSQQGLIREVTKRPLAQHLMREMILFTLTQRKFALTYHAEIMNKMAEKSLETLSAKKKKAFAQAMSDFNYFQNTSVFNLIFKPAMMDRFTQDESTKDLTDLYWQVFYRVDVTPFRFDQQDVRLLSIESQNIRQLMQTETLEGQNRKAMQQQQ